MQGLKIWEARSTVVGIICPPPPLVEIGLTKIMGKDISLGLSFKAVYFDFCSTNVGSSVIRTRSTTGFDIITR